jgi:hypothetical protein
VGKLKMTNGGSKMSVRLISLMRVVMTLAIVLGLFAQVSPALADDGGGGDGGTGDGGGSGGKIVEALRQVAQWFVGVMIGIASILMAVGILTGFVGGQFMVTVGNPLGLSTAWMRVISVVLLGILAILGVVISNEILDIVAGLATGAGIKVITP